MWHLNSRILFCLLALIPMMGTNAQNSLNMTLLYQYDDPSIGRYSDVWGYEDNGTEVAIIASRDSLIFFDITNTSQVVKLPAIAPGGTSDWRDVKCFGNYCYGITDVDANDGLTIVNMDSLLNGTLTYHSVTSEFTKAHNIFIDETTSKMYIVGAGGAGRQGYIVYDLSMDPYNPTHLATVDLGPYISCTSTYLHDLYVRNDTAYCNVIYNGCGYYILDVSTPSSPIVLGSIPGQGFQNGLNHSNWITADGKYAVVAEETHGNPIHIVDLTDPANPVHIATWKEPLDAGLTDNIAHNPIIKGDFCYISYYHDGVCILDISDPFNPTRVAYYDTHAPVGYGGYEGAWGVYPLLPSGVVLAADRNNGLFVFEVSNAILPIDWIRFEAFEKGNDRFSIQAQFQSTEDLEKAELYWSLDGRDFEKWADLDYEKDNVQQYTIDEELDRPTSNGFYVQVKTTEIDGYESRSIIRRIQEAEAPEIEIYPNPATNMLYISQEKDAHMDMLSLEGKKVLSLKLQKGLNEVPLPGSILKGTYILRFTDSLDKTQYSSTVQILR